VRTGEAQAGPCRGANAGSIPAGKPAGPRMVEAYALAGNGCRKQKSKKPH
jgi:hypothetical protein